MEATDKLLGSAGTQLVVGVGPTAVKTGYAAYCCKVRVDDTQIKSLTPGEIVDETGDAVTNESWENVALLKDDYISFSDPIVSITMNSATDSVMLYLVPLRKS